MVSAGLLHAVFACGLKASSFRWLEYEAEEEEEDEEEEEEEEEEDEEEEDPAADDGVAVEEGEDRDNLTSETGTGEREVSFSSGVSLCD